jgi:hypothetical protein
MGSVASRRLGQDPVAYKHLRDFGIHTVENFEESQSWTRLGARIHFGNSKPGEMPADDYYRLISVMATGKW